MPLARSQVSGHHDRPLLPFCLSSNASCVAANEPVREDGAEGGSRASGSAQRKKDPNRGFKTAADGRLIIEDIEDYSDSDEDPDDALGYADKAKKRVYDQEDSDDDSETEGHHAAQDDDDDGPSSRKRKAIDALSARSGMTGASSNRYVAGGKGIHRPTAASVRSGYSGRSVKSTKTAKSNASTGKEYRSKKAAGDMLKKGKHEPYAYVPLSRNSLNRRYIHHCAR